MVPSIRFRARGIISAASSRELHLQRLNQTLGQPTHHSHFFPFFFFFPPAPPVPACAVFASSAFAFPPSSAAPTAAASGASTMTASADSASSGNAAIVRPRRPRLAISLPTSAALSVRYFRQTPDTGSYVFSVSVAVGEDVVSAVMVDGSAGVATAELETPRRDSDFFDLCVAGKIVCLVVMRV